MAVRVPWDKYEAAILLDACLRVDQGKMDRASAITYVSKTLRERAIKQGKEIDSVFRNENGISMQLSAMMTCVHHKSGGLTISKVFREVVELYESDRENFNMLVQEAANSNFHKTKVETFASWLEEQEKYISFANEIIQQINIVSVFLLKSGVIKAPILKSNSKEEVNRALVTLKENKILHIHSAKQLRKYVYAVNAFLEYLSRENTCDEAFLSAMPQENEESNLQVNFTKPTGFAYTRPDYFKFEGLDAVPVKNWTKLYVNVLNELCRRDSELLKSLVGKNISGATRIDFLNSDESLQMTAPCILNNGLAVETNLSASDIVRKIRVLLDIYGIPYSSLMIIYHKRDKKTTENTLIDGEHPSHKWLPKYTEPVRRVLEKHYSYGFRMNSPIEMMRFRNYAERDMISLPVSDEELSREISTAGMLIDGKIYSFDKDTQSGLLSLVSAIFDGGSHVIFLEPFMDINSEWLEEHYLLSPEMIKEVLCRNCSDFYCGQNIITFKEKETEHEAVVSEIHRVSKTESVVWLSDLCEKLPYIPNDKIAWSLSACDDFVWISEGKYFVMEHFVISENELATIRAYVASECCENGYVSITDLPFGTIPEENYELSITALYSAVYIAVLKPKYQLNGKILTCNDEKIDIVVLLKRYCQNRLSCTMAEVMNKAVELVGTQNRQNSFIALYDTMIRTDKENFVSDSQVQFDVDLIDEELQDIIGERFIPIKGVTTFGLFPSCGKTWNHYLLESFCYRFSKKYRLCVLNYNDKNAGIIVAKSFNMNYTDMLCDAVARSGIPLTTEAVGGFLFENGFSAKRKLSNLPEITEKAAKIREEE